MQAIPEDRKKLIAAGAIIGLCLLILAIVYFPSGRPKADRSASEQSQAISAKMREQEQQAPPQPIAENPDPQPGLGPVRGDP